MRAGAAGLPLVLALVAGGACAQAPAPCPRAGDVRVEQLYGLWHASFEGQARGASLLLEKHPRYAASVSGGVDRDGAQGVISGELEDGAFEIEESADGVHIAATWVGEIVDGSCGREIRGEWKRDGETRTVPFVMRKE